jgi:hypothetical protein
MAKITPKNSSKTPAAKPGKDTVYVDVDDEITAIIDKVESAKQKIVALVLPKRATALQSIVNMRLLKRSASNSGKNVVLITSEHALLPLAGAAGIHVAKNLQSKPEIPPSPHTALPEVEQAEEVEDLDDQPQKLDYDKPIGELAATNDEPEEIALDDEDAAAAGAAASAVASAPHKKPKGKGLKVPNFDRFRVLLFGGIAALILLIIFFIFASTVLPHATITVSTSSTPVSLNTNLTASVAAKSLDEASKTIPSFLKTSDQTANQQVNATGKKNLGEKASGNVRMTARACAPHIDTPTDVPPGTGISSNGLSFITQDAASFSISGGSGSCVNYSSNKVDIAAQDAGEKYNVNDATFSVPGRSDVSAKGSADGGTDNNVSIVTQQDVDGAKSKISSADSDKFSKDFQNQLSGQGLYVITSTLKIGDPAVTSTPAVGQQASSASVTVKITYSVLALKRDDLKTYVEDVLNKQIDPKKEKLSDSDVLSGLDVAVQGQNGANATLVLTKDTAAVPILDEQAIKANSKGKKESQIRDYINTYPGVKNVDVKLSPFWVSHAPKNTGKIKIVEKQVKQDNK